MADEKVGITITARDQATAVLQKVKGEIIGIGAAYFSWQGAKDIIGSIVDAHIDAERSLVKLRSAVIRSGEVWEQQRQSLLNYASSVQRLTIYDDELVQRGLARLIDYGLSTKEATDALTTATDLAAGREMDLMSAVDLIAKAHAGNTAALSRYVGTVDDAIPKAEAFTTQMSKLRDMFGGAAQAELSSMEGRIKELKNAFNDFLENIGGDKFWNAIKGAIAGLSEYLRQLPGLISNATTMLKAWYDVFSGNLTASAIILKQFGTLMKDVFTFNWSSIDEDWVKFRASVDAAGDIVSINFGNAINATKNAVTGLQNALAMIAVVAGAASGESSEKMKKLKKDIDAAAIGLTFWSIEAGKVIENVIDPEAITPTLVGTTKDIDKELKKLRESAARTASAIGSMLAPSITDLITKTRSASDIIKSLGLQLLDIGIKAMIEFAVQQIIVSAKTASITVATYAEMGAHYANTLALNAEATAYYNAAAAKAAYSGSEGGSGGGGFDFGGFNPLQIVKSIIPNPFGIFGAQSYQGQGFAGATGSTNVVVNFSGPITDTSYVEQKIAPVIAAAASGGRVKIATRSYNATGRLNGAQI